MGTITVDTAVNGTVTITDVVTNSMSFEHCLSEGVDICDEEGNLLCEIMGYCTEDLVDDPDLVDELIDTFGI